MRAMRTVFGPERDDRDIRIQFIMDILMEWTTYSDRIVEKIAEDIVNRLDRDFENHKAAIVQLEIDNREAREKYWDKFKAGLDFGFVTRALDPEYPEKKYGRFNGQMYYVKREGIGDFRLFAVDKVGEIGKTTEPYSFRGYKEAKDAILAGKVRIWDL